jgi:periplasmic copper chaperone A
MRRWAIAFVLGLVVLGAIYIYRERVTREQPETATTPAPESEAASEPSTNPQSSTAEVPEKATASSETTTTESALAQPMGSITVDNDWARESTPQGVTAVYMVLILVADESDRLVGAQSSAADSVEIHETRIENGIAKMRHLDDLDIEPETPVVFEPGGLHLMVIGLKHPLKSGDSLPLVLQFAHAGKLTLEVPVGEPTGTDALGHSQDE